MGEKYYHPLSACSPEEPRPFSRAPAHDECDGDDREPAGEADPEAEAGKRRQEGEGSAERQADAPIAGKGDHHRDSRIVQAAQHPGHDHLSPVEKLEHRGDAQELLCQRDRLGIRRLIGVDEGGRR